MRQVFRDDLDVGPTIDIGEERCGAILRTIESGWHLALASPDVHRDLREVELTECLRDGMRDALTRFGDAWCRTVTILPGTESRSPQVRVPDGRTDVSVFFAELREVYDEHDPHAIVECKRIAEQRTDLCRLYVVEGVDRFRSAKYGHRHAVGFMVGYLIAGAIDGTVDKINRYLPSEEALAKCTVIDEPWMRSSRHPRPAGAPPIEVHHAMLVMSLAVNSGGGDTAGQR